MPRLESAFKPRVLNFITTELLPGSLALHQDANLLQGIPDTQILFERRWGFLEFKRSANAKPRPNQPYYVELLNRMSFARFIYPENEWEVLRELESALRS